MEQENQEEPEALRVCLSTAEGRGAQKNFYEDSAHLWPVFSVKSCHVPAIILVFVLVFLTSSYPITSINFF